MLHQGLKNCQKWKQKILYMSLPCIFRVKAVGLSFPIIITSLVSMWNLGQFCEKWYFVNNRLMLNQNLTHIIVIIYRTPYFYLTDYQLNADSPFKFCALTVKSASVAKRSLSQESVF